VGHRAGTQHRSNILLERPHDSVHCLGGDQALFDEELLEGEGPRLQLAGWVRMVAVIVGLLPVVILAHGPSLR
jgi:hypothetical protein